MPEIGMSVSMSGDGKRGVGHRPQATAPILDSTGFCGKAAPPMMKRLLASRPQAGSATVVRRNLAAGFLLIKACPSRLAIADYWAAFYRANLRKAGNRSRVGTTSARPSGPRSRTAFSF